MTKPSEKLNIEQITKDILTTIDKEREQEIISRRFGLFDRKETLEQIGELLGITRERVRQLEKVIITRMSAQSASGSIPHITDTEKAITDILEKQGGIATVSNLTRLLVDSTSKLDQARIAFIGTLAPNLTIVLENDNYHQAVGLKSNFKDVKSANKQIDIVVDAIKKINKPAKIDEVAKQAKINNPQTAESLASASKLLASLNGEWGLVKWPTVNPKNIRDKIYVILKENKKQMHFSEISKKIKTSDFKRKDVTTQAIHNELIKDPRFVLVGRGIYALKEWGYKKGTVSDVIADILKKANEPLHRDEIVKLVLKNRYVKETTILLNLQGKKQFKRVAKATYTLAEDNA